ncbi:MAG: hypothetical protein ACXWLH_02755 [Candidatus Saccharimonadales bacterium]
MRRAAIFGIVLLSLTYLIYDLGRDNWRLIGSGPLVILLAFGYVMWSLLNKISSHRPAPAAIQVNYALWLHSLLEAAMAAISFSFGLRAGFIISAALLLHLLPEYLLVAAALKYYRRPNRQIFKTYLISMAILFASFGLFATLPKVPATIVSALTAVVAGGIIYIAWHLLNQKQPAA